MCKGKCKGNGGHKCNACALLAKHRAMLKSKHHRPKGSAKAWLARPR